MGTITAQSNGMAVVIGIGTNTQIGSIARMIQVEEEETLPRKRSFILLLPRALTTIKEAFSFSAVSRTSV